MKVQLEVNGLTTAEVIPVAQGIVTQTTGNANYPTPVPTLASIQALIDAAQAKLDASNIAFDALREARSERRAATRALVDGLELLAGYVQAASGGDEAKILSSGMGVRQPAEPVGPLPAPTDLRAETGAYEGTVDVEWGRIYGARGYFVECASAATGPWTESAQATASRVTVEGLTSGAKYFLRVRALGTAGFSPWSLIIQKMAG